ncbi:MAG: protein kinase domain-containing protein [Nitrospiraceae bacterium]
MDSQLFSGKYTVEGEIARGGMGVIYKAVHATLNRSVAIKVLHAQYANDPAFLKRFLQEARAMARVEHENIIQVFDVHEDGGSYSIVMEYFPGKDLKHLMTERGRISPQETLSIGRQAASALAYAHEQGVIHRDIKPRNIMVDNQGIVKIADFGIAAATGESSITAIGQIVGTPEYMSPEQACGENRDGRSDLYSLGMVLYEMLTGHTAYEGVSRMAIVGKLQNEHEDVPLKFPEDVPGPLQDLVGSLLRRRPENRIANARTLMHRIEELQQGFPNSELEVLETLTGISRKNGSAVGAGESYGAPGPSEDASSSSHAPRPEPAEALHMAPPSGSLSSGKPSSSLTTTRAAGSTLRTARAVSPIAVAAGLAVAVMVTAVGLSYLSSNRQKLASSPPAQDRASQAEKRLLAEIRDLQGSARTAQDKVAQARSAAEAVGAKRQATRTYQQAVGLETKASEALQQGSKLLSERRFGEARASFQAGLSQLSQARDGFVQAREATLVGMAELRPRAAEGATREGPQQENIKRATGSMRGARGVAIPKTSPQAAVNSLAEVREMLTSARTLQERVAQARTGAEASGARQQRLRNYQQSVEFEAQGLQAVQMGESFINQNRYPEAKTALHSALTLLTQARGGYDAAWAMTVAMVADANQKAPETAPIQKPSVPEKPNPVREQIRGAQPVQPAARQATPASSPAATSRPDIEAVREIVVNLKQAYESHDLPQLKRTTEMSGETARTLEQIFQDYGTIKVSYVIWSVTKQDASAIISINELVDRQGRRMRPEQIEEKWKPAKVVMRKKDDKWDKISW